MSQRDKKDAQEVPRSPPQEAPKSPPIWLRKLYKMIIKWNHWHSWVFLSFRLSRLWKMSHLKLPEASKINDFHLFFNGFGVLSYFRTTSCGVPPWSEMVKNWGDLWFWSQKRSPNNKTRLGAWSSRARSGVIFRKTDGFMRGISDELGRGPPSIIIY